MRWEALINQLSPAKFLLQCGPMHMTVEAWRDSKPCAEAIDAAINRAFLGLMEVAQFRQQCSRWINEVSNFNDLTELVASMHKAVAATRFPWVTSMAAVAGALAADSAAAAFRQGASRVICNNGGDIALFLAEEESVTIGIASSLQDSKIDSRIRIRSSDGIGGICTSGLGGRSLTLGIASAVTVFAEQAPLADVAATLIANQVSAEHPGIIRKRAEELQPGTDIAGLWATEKVGELPEAVWEEAIHNGVSETNRLLTLGIIKGAVLHAGGKRVVVKGDIPELEFI